MAQCVTPRAPDLPEKSIPSDNRTHNAQPMLVWSTAPTLRGGTRSIQAPHDVLMPSAPRSNAIVTDQLTGPAFSWNDSYRAGSVIL